MLLCRSDFSSKDRFTNFQAAIEELLNLRVIPIINENDTVSIAELKFGDNDTLSALIAVSLSADKLCLLTDVDFLYTADPRTASDAQPVRILTTKQLAVWHNPAASAGGTQWGTGGMATKIVAARTAVCAGVEVLLSNGTNPERISDFLLSADTHSAAEFYGTKFLAIDDAAAVGAGASSSMTKQRRWLLALPVRGEIFVDAGAVEALGRKKSLFSAGIVEVKGDFIRDECVAVRGRETSAEIARVLVNFPSEEIRKLQGKQSHEHAAILGYNCDPEVAFREHIVLL
jgi:glutamate 5-kinase